MIVEILSKVPTEMKETGRDRGTFERIPETRGIIETIETEIVGEESEVSTETEIGTSIDRGAIKLMRGSNGFEVDGNLHHHSSDSLPRPRPSFLLHHVNLSHRILLLPPTATDLALALRPLLLLPHCLQLRFTCELEVVQLTKSSVPLLLHQEEVEEPPYL